MVPENIRKIERPKNTVLLPTKHRNIYMVLQRIGCTYDKGRRLPKNGKVIGHIIDGKYVPKAKKSGRKKLTERNVSVMKYANVACPHPSWSINVSRNDQIYIDTINP